MYSKCCKDRPWGDLNGWGIKLYLCSHSVKYVKGPDGRDVWCGCFIN